MIVNTSVGILNRSQLYQKLQYHKLIKFNSVLFSSTFGYYSLVLVNIGFGLQFLITKSY